MSQETNLFVNTLRIDDEDFVKYLQQFSYRYIFKEWFSFQVTEYSFICW